MLPVLGLLVAILSHSTISMTVNDTAAAAGLLGNRIVASLHQQQGGTRNDCTSTIGLMAAISLLYPCATEPARKELDTLLGFQSSETGRHLFLALEERYKTDEDDDGSASRGPKIVIASSVWVDAATVVSKAYSDILQNSLKVISFANDGGQTINEWADHATNGRISSIVPKGPLPGSLVAVNAIYLKGAWAKPFSRTKTTSGLFYADLERLSIQTSRVQFLHQVDRFPYLDIGTHELVQLAIAGREGLSLIVASPKTTTTATGAGVTTTTRLMMMTDLLAVLGRFQPVPVALVLPKFKYSASYDNDFLLGVLKDFGMQAAFQQGAFQIGEKAATELGSIIQKTFVAVDENGVEAAAVTAIRSRSAPRPVRDPPTLVLLDHAFQFFIVDQDVVLFEGYVTDPSTGGADEAGTAEDETYTITSPVDHAKAVYWQENFGVVPIGLEETSSETFQSCADTSS